MAGQRVEATAIFGRLVREIHARSKPDALVTGVAGTATLVASSDGTRVLAHTRGGAYWFDRDGAALRYQPDAALSAAFVPGTSLVVLADPDLTVIDAATFGQVLRVPNVMDAKASPSGKLLVYVESDAARTTFHTWDVATRHEVRSFDLRAGESWQLSSIGFSPDEREMYFELSTPATTDELGNAIDGGEQHLVLIDDAGHRVDFPARLGNSQPSFSSDGKYVAYGYSVYTEGKGSEGKVVLIDRATRKQLVSSSVDYPTATQFTNDGKRLIVGALRELLVLEVPALRVVATTPEMRPRYPEDDQQDIGTIEIIGADKAFWASTADGTTAVFRLPSAKLVWKGPEGTPAERVASASGAAFELEGARVTIDETFAVRSRPLTQARPQSPDPMEAVSARLETTVCTIGERVFPIAACSEW